MLLSEEQVRAALPGQPELLQLIFARPEQFVWLDTPEVLLLIRDAYGHMDEQARRELARLSDACALRDRLFETYLKWRYAEASQNPDVDTKWPLACFEELLSAFAILQTWWDYRLAGILIDWDGEFGDWRTYPEAPPLSLAEPAVTLGLWVADAKKELGYRFVGRALRDFLVYRAGMRLLEQGRSFSAVLLENRDVVRADLKLLMRPLRSFWDYDLIVALYCSADPRVVNLLKAALFKGTFRDTDYVLKALQSLNTPHALEVIRQWQERNETASEADT